jgi:hypothetical protein
MMNGVFSWLNVPDQTTFRNYALKANDVPCAGTRLHFTFIENNIRAGRDVRHGLA